MDRGSARPASSRQRIDVSTDDKRILEAAARTPAVLDAFNMQWMLVAAAVKPVSAKAADIGAAALGKLLGTVKYVGLPHNEQVDTTQFRLPDRTAGPASPPLVQLPNGLSAAVDGVIEHARATLAICLHISPVVVRRRHVSHVVWMERIGRLGVQCLECIECLSVSIQYFGQHWFI